MSAASVPAPRDDPKWMRCHTELVAEANTIAQEHADTGDDLNFLFLGDSIIERLRGTQMGVPNSWFLDSHDVWNQVIAPLSSLALGISGDGTQHLLYRLLNGELAPRLDPKVVILMIGTNNIHIPAKFNPQNYDFSSLEVATAIRIIVNLISQMYPSSQVLILGILPRGGPTDILSPSIMSKIREVNAELENFANEMGGNIHFLDCSGVFLDSFGNINQSLMQDFLHPSPEGYQHLFAFLIPFLNQLLCFSS